MVNHLSRCSLVWKHSGSAPSLISLAPSSLQSLFSSSAWKSLDFFSFFDFLYHISLVFMHIQSSSYLTHCWKDLFQDEMDLLKLVLIKIRLTTEHLPLLPLGLCSFCETGPSRMLPWSPNPQIESSVTDICLGSLHIVCSSGVFWSSKCTLQQAGHNLKKSHFPQPWESKPSYRNMTSHEKAVWSLGKVLEKFEYKVCVGTVMT